MSVINATLVESPKSLFDKTSRTPLPVKILVAVLLMLFIALLYRLVFGDGSVQEVWQLHLRAEQQRQENEVLRERNQTLEAEVQDLKKGLDAIEERARTELGMIREGEQFYQFIDRERTPGSDDPASDEQLVLPPADPAQ